MESSSNPFTILNNTPDNIFCEVFDELDVLVEDKNALTECIKAEEILRANIAEANYKEFLHKQSEKHAEPDCED